MKSIFEQKHFKDEAAAYSYVESKVWANGRVCPHCGVVDRSGALKGKSTRLGVYKCYACRKPFTVKVGTIFESSHVPMHLWLQAMHLLCSSKKGISANQLHRILGCTLRTAWFIAHRIREAMDDKGTSGPLGGVGKIVEADETYIAPTGPRDDKPATFINGIGWTGHLGPRKDAIRVITLVERGGRARSVVAERLDTKTVYQFVVENASRDSRLMTDEFRAYNRAGKEFVSHERVNHSHKEYARGDVTTNTVEGYFSVFKRGMRGTYQHCKENHLHRYLSEFDFRYSNRVALGIDDVSRADIALRGIVGKRLTLR